MCTLKKGLGGTKVLRKWVLCSAYNKINPGGHGFPLPFGLTLHWFVVFSKRKNSQSFLSAEWWMERALL